MSNSFVPIHHPYDLAEIALIEGVLLSAGIRYYIENDHGTRAGVFGGTLNVARTVYVERESAEHGRELIADALAS